MILKKKNYIPQLARYRWMYRPIILFLYELSLADLYSHIRDGGIQHFWQPDVIKCYILLIWCHCPQTNFWLKCILRSLFPIRKKSAHYPLGFYTAHDNSVNWYTIISIYVYPILSYWCHNSKLKNRTITVMTTLMSS